MVYHMMLYQSAGIGDGCRMTETEPQPPVETQPPPPVQTQESARETGMDAAPDTSADREVYQAVKDEILSPASTSEAPGASFFMEDDEDGNITRRDEFGDTIHESDEDDGGPAGQEDTPDGSLPEDEDGHAASDHIPQEAPTPTADPSLPTGMAGLDAERQTALEGIQQKRALIAEAEAQLRYEDKPALLRELQELEARLQTLDGAAPRIAAEEEACARDFAQGYAASVNRAIELHPQAGVKGSPFQRRMVEVDRSLRASGDPLFTSVDKPLRLAEMVAREMRGGSGGPIFPPLPPLIASGSARTMGTPLSTAESAIASVTNPDQLELLKLQLLGRSTA